MSVCIIPVVSTSSILSNVHETINVLEISGHCTLFAAVFKVKASSLYYASPWTHQVDGAVIANNAMESKVVITYADRVWVEVGSSERDVL